MTSGASVASPGIRTGGLSINKATAIKYPPWTMPELVTFTRRFLSEMSRQLSHTGRPIIIGIDELDRIGSLEQAERFIGEIKAIFGIERCYFLVTVAEDVGSAFAQRATAGRSILENAFDEVVTIEPLEIQEARDLLLRRVPGFTDSFVYLVYALSGGLPRELIRVTRRLIEINRDQQVHGNLPRIADLALALVAEQMAEALDAGRIQASRLNLDADWAPLLDAMRSSSVELKRGSARTSQAFSVLGGIAEMRTPCSTVKVYGGAATNELDRAARIVDGLAAFAAFGTTLIDAFSDDAGFSLEEARKRAEAGAANAYEELAGARAELAISPTSTRMILARFRGTQ